MSPNPQSGVAPSHTVAARRAAQIKALATPADLRALPLAVLHLVMAKRLIGLCDRAARDPVSELALRLRSCTAAVGLVELAEKLDRAWPEPFTAGRPCWRTMTPDEATLAAMARTALRGDRVGFGQALAGFVRADRHDALYDATRSALAAVCAAMPATG